MESLRHLGAKLNLRMRLDYAPLLSNFRVGISRECQLLDEDQACPMTGSQDLRVKSETYMGTLDYSRTLSNKFSSHGLLLMSPRLHKTRQEKFDSRPYTEQACPKN